MSMSGLFVWYKDLQYAVHVTWEGGGDQCPNKWNMGLLDDLDQMFQRSANEISGA